MSHMRPKRIPKDVRAYLSQIGRVGGSKSSAAKTAAARANAKRERPSRRKREDA